MRTAIVLNRSNSPKICINEIVNPTLYNIYTQYCLTSYQIIQYMSLKRDDKREMKILFKNTNHAALVQIFMKSEEYNTVVFCYLKGWFWQEILRIAVIWVSGRINQGNWPTRVILSKNDKPMNNL